MFKKPNKEEHQQKIRKEYFDYLDLYNIRPTNQILRAIEYLIKNFNDILLINLPKHKYQPQLIVAIIDKSYFKWYLENVKYPNNICYDISEKMFNILYEE